MQSVYAYFDGKTVVLPDDINHKKNQKVLVTFLEDETSGSVRHLGKITDDNYETLLEALSRGENVEYDYDDPFFSPENVNKLNRAIKNLDEYGKGSFHDIIEAEDDE
jgi:hypothetical protein